MPLATHEVQDPANIKADVPLLRTSSLQSSKSVWWVFPNSKQLKKQSRLVVSARGFLETAYCELDTLLLRVESSLSS